MTMEPLLQRDFDLRLQPAAHIQIVGKTGSGKTCLALKLVRQAAEVWQQVPSKVILLYQVYQQAYEETKQVLEKCGIAMSLREGGEMCLSDVERNERHTIIVIDDASLSSPRSEETARLAIAGRPANITLILCWHSIFFNSPTARLISANMTYLFILPSPRLNSQVATLDSQLQFKGRLKKVYALVCDDPDYEARYLFVDLSSTAPTEFRLRTRITCSPQHVFLP